MTSTDTHPLASFRDVKGWTQVQLADYLGITQAHLSRVEAGEGFCSPKMAQRISEKTGIARDRLLDFGDNKPGRSLTRRRAGNRLKR